MARTKRKVNPILPVAAPVPKFRIYRVGGYVRLSIEDSGKPGADTLATQQALIEAYIGERPDLSLVNLYCDNGHTGTDFDRPAFDRLLADIRSDKIDCVVVKDLSRFGRSYRETGTYIQRIFPYLGVRFISVNDHFDTLTAEQNEYGFIVPLKNIINETYSRDISRKVSSAITAKELRGEFIGVWAPYGYRKSTADRHRLEPNPETAPVVREIFSLRLQGMGYTGIARLLNDRGTPSPGAYLFQTGQSNREDYRKSIWSVWNIKEILRNEVYLGHLIQGKRTQASYKRARKERFAPTNEWRAVHNTHEALVSEGIFAEVQALAEQSKDAYEANLGKADDLKTPNLFRRLIYCADCGTALTRRHIYSNWGEERHYYYSFVCLRSLRMASGCTPKNLMERDLLKVVSDTVKAHLAAVTELEVCVERVWRERTAARSRDLDSRMDAAEREMSRVRALLDGLYLHLVDGALTREEYLSLKESYLERQNSAAEAMEQLRAERLDLDRCTPANPMFAAVHAARNGEILSEELLHTLVERIDVHDNSRVEIRLRYQDELLYLALFFREVMQS